ncbi:DUF2796 domain-containing protein [Pseudomonas sp.]|uniref:DUF2796 domain-containing protein n=1 Tax=Pseudomonas sp. TaxID=306 RepID=UPI003D11D53C
MRRLLLALPFALLPLVAAQASDHDGHDHGHSHSHAHDHAHDHDHDHDSLGAHEHGVAQLNAVLDGQTLELELVSPAMNLVGFEHAASSDADKAKVASARALLEKPQALFGLAAGNCSTSKQELESPLFEGAKHSHEGEHSDIHAHYQLDCKQANALKQLDLGNLFKHFPATEKVQVQLIGPNGQQGVELTPAQPTLSF